jgi:deazaflavin-dependent oxidoreductase (nitroreductase family)
MKSRCPAEPACPGAERDVRIARLTPFRSGTGEDDRRAVRCPAHSSSSVRRVVAAQWSPPAVSNDPVVRLAWNLGIPIPGGALLEPTGRRTGLPRRTAVCDGLDGETFWLVAQRGRSAGWVRNIEANPRVRVRVSGLRTGWRAGTAHLLDGDDPQERRILARANPARLLCMCTTKAPNTSPLTSTNRSGFAVTHRGAAARARNAPVWCR